MQECTEHLRFLGYSEACITLHQKKWSEYLLPYLQEKGIVFYSTEVGEYYLKSVLPDLTPFPKRVLTRSVHILSSYLDTGVIPKKIVQMEEHPLPGEIGEAARLFLKEQISKRRCETTVLKHRRNLSYFIVFLETRSKSKLSDIEEEDVVSFLSTSRNAIDRYFSLRLFLRFLSIQEYIQTDFEYVLSRNRYPKREKLPSIYSAEEIQQIELSVEQSGPVGKRDYAILLLATRLGLRASDICRLKFEHLDWDHNVIAFTQYKTRKAIELPLLTEVGEAIVNYLRYGRPVSEHPEIFLSARPPYRPMFRWGINSAISRIMKTIAYDNSKRIVNVRYYLYGSNGKIEKMYSKGSRGSREETYFYENDRLQKIVIRQFDRNDIEQDTLQHSFDYKSNGELKSIILSTELYSETIYQET